MSGPRAAALALAGALACANTPREAISPYVPDRRDYLAFRADHPELLEPNYLPFMAHRLRGGASGRDVLVLCHWAPEDLPLAVAIEPPKISPRLQDEFDPKPPEEYMRAAARAFATWERELEGLVRFERQESAANARLVVRLLGERAPVAESEVKVLGTTPLRDACRSGDDPDQSQPLRTRYAAPDILVYVADEFGLLHPDQVYRVALHEIGHALGMRGHSPAPADLMYEVARDRALAESLSAQDVNSFVSLYRLASGTLYARLERGDVQAPPLSAPTGPPRLAISPHVDARFGFELRPPEGWQRVETARGVAMVDGVSWDYDASLQILVLDHLSADDYLVRYGAAHLARGMLRERSEVELAGRAGVRLRIESFGGPVIEELTLANTGDGRLLVVIADCPASLYAGYQPWFEATLRSLELVPRPPLRTAPEPSAETTATH